MTAYDDPLLGTSLPADDPGATSASPRTCGSSPTGWAGRATGWARWWASRAGPAPRPPPRTGD